MCFNCSPAQSKEPRFLPHVYILRQQEKNASPSWRQNNRLRHSHHAFQQMSHIDYHARVAEATCTIKNSNNNVHTDDSSADRPEDNACMPSHSSSLTSSVWGGAIILSENGPVVRMPSTAVKGVNKQYTNGSHLTGQQEKRGPHQRPLYDAKRQRQSSPPASQKEQDAVKQRGKKRKKDEPRSRAASWRGKLPDAVSSAAYKIKKVHCTL